MDASEIEPSLTPAEIDRLSKTVATRFMQLSHDEAMLFLNLGQMARQQLAYERDLILKLARQHAHPGCNPATHDLAGKILKVLGDR